METRTQLQKTEEYSKEQVQNLQYTREQLQKAENKLRSDAISSYADTVQKLNIKIETERFVGKFDWDKSLYLPAIEVNGKKYLLSESSSSFSLNNISTFYSKVLNLAMTTSKPDQKSGSSAASVAGPLYVNNEKTAIFFPLSDDKLPALKTLSYSNLKQRGTQNLTLFKANSYGRETADLQGRCSLGLTDNPDGSGYLYIRNSQQGSELQTALGDFVLSKEGEFVGIVVAMRSSNLTAKSEAVCWILPEKMEIEKFQQLRLNKKSGSAYFEDFSADFQKVFSINANAK